MKQTILDLRDDFTKLLTLAQSGQERLLAHQKHLEDYAENYQPAAHSHLLESVRNLNATYLGHIQKLQSNLQIPDNLSIDEIKELIFQKKEAAHLHRILQSELAALLTAGDWQSPSFDHTVMSLAGKQAGKIVANMSDYKRDWHFDGSGYEKSFCDAYVDSGLHIPPHAFVTSSGMSAFTTIIEHLRLQLKITGPIMAGQSSYFENKWILDRAFPGQVTYFDEFKTDEIIALAEKLKPSAFFIDTRCNTEMIPIPDMKKLIAGLSKCLPLSAVLVIDNTGMATSCQPLQLLPTIMHPRYFIFESLNKYHQFGGDRVTGGIILQSPATRYSIFMTRMHLGTVMPDASVHALPVPNRELLDKQLQRFNRNTLMIAQALEDHLIKNPHPLVSHVVYPGLKSYPGYSWTKDLSFHGSFFSILFHPSKKNSDSYLKIINKLLSQAKKENVDLIAGSSFGLDITRLYITAKFASDLTIPFLRVSVGTETEFEIKELINVFIKALSS